MATDLAKKRVEFDTECSEEGEDESKSVEVVFDPSNPYRRKSSLVSSEVSRPPLPQRPAKRDECIVHQFLECQRRAAENAENDATSSIYHSGYSTPSTVQFSGTDAVAAMSAMTGAKLPSDVVAKHKSSGAAAAAAAGVDGTKSPCRAQLDLQSLENNEMGQADQEAWTREITKSVSELDLKSQADDDEIHSRMLTKKQLSDMAWGVRELSRRLSSMRMRIRVKTIFLLTKIYDQDLVPKTRELTKWLLDSARDTRYTVYVQDKLKTNKKFDVAGLIDEAAKSYVEAGVMSSHEKAKDDIRRRIRYWDEGMCRTRPHTFDFVITLGGDGTVLYASWLFQRIVPPVLSFALGSLGFLTKFDFDAYATTLNSAFNNGVTVSLRLRFEGTVMRSQKRINGASESGSSTDEEDGMHHKKRDLVEELIGEEKEDAHTHRPDGTYEILNEIVVDRGPNPTMSSTELFGDDEHFTSIMADGICVSTPTGSTAYNLAAGGSLCHPENPVMLVTSICAHTLSFRPIILPDTIVLRVGVPYDARNASWASFDGRERVELNPGDYVTISASRYPFATVQAEGRRSQDWVNSISGKLGWNTRQRQKGYQAWDS